MWKRFSSAAAILACVLGFALAKPVLAAPISTGYQGEIVAGTDALNMKPGETKRVEVQIKNTGTVTWKKSDKAYPILYTYFPKYRTSVFRSASWSAKDSPMKYSGADVKPSASGVFAFDITAPKTAGVYEEGFWIAAFDKTWIPGTQFKLLITVTTAKTAIAKPLPTPSAQVTPTPVVTNPTTPKVAAQSDISSAFSGNYQALVMLKGQRITARGGVPATYRTGIKNISAQEWPGYAIRTANMVQIATSSMMSLADVRAPAWPTANIALAKEGVSVAPGALELMNIDFRMPSKKGDYTLAFNLNVQGMDVDGGLIEIPVTVTDDAFLPPPATTPTQQYNQQPITEQLGAEPTVRIGLYKTTTGESIQSDESFHVQDTNGKVLFDQPANSSVTLLYENGRYKANSDQGLFGISDQPLRLVPTDGAAIFTVATRPNRPIWNDSLNDNRFRGVMEVRYSSVDKTTWIINELPMEQYLKGLIEAGEGTTYPAEYQKALVTAARTYAYYHWTTKAKHANRGFDLDANYDQVYRGYGAEVRSPRTSAAVDATRGSVVQYLGNIAVTPYGTRTDGRTRSYQEAWGKAVSYLVSVPAPYDVGKTLLGHGVGMSQMDAVGHAKNEGWDWQRIVKYYYTGVDIVRKW